MTRKILLIGGSGYIGNVIDSQLKKKYIIYKFDNLIYNQNKNFLLEKKHFIKGDITKKKDLLKLINFKFDSVIILAGLVGDPITKKYKKKSVLINEKGILNVVNFFKKKNLCDKIIFVSTCSNYGLAKNRIVDEKSKLKPLSQYAKSKVKIEKNLLNQKKNHFETIILRFSTAFGLSKRMRYDLTVNQFCLEMKLYKNIKVYDSDTWRPYCHVKDFARIMDKIIKSKKNLDRHVFNVGDNKFNYSKKKIAQTIQKIIGGNIEYLKNSKDRRDYKVSFNKINKNLNFKCKYNLEYGIKEILNDLSKKSNSQLKKCLELGNFKL